jgi:hypothetical protein
MKNKKCHYTYDRNFSCCGKTDIKLTRTCEEAAVHRPPVGDTALLSDGWLYTSAKQTILTL